MRKADPLWLPSVPDDPATLAIALTDCDAAQMSDTRIIGSTRNIAE